MLHVCTDNGNQAAGEGANLYGVEPASYYIINLALNFNAIAILACLTPVAIMLVMITPTCVPTSSDDASPLTHTAASSMSRYMSGAVLWLTLMFRMAHKEERFLIVIYPFITWSAAYATYVLFVFVAGTMGTRKRRYSDDATATATSSTTATSTSHGCRYHLFSTCLRS